MTSPSLGQRDLATIVPNRIRVYSIVWSFRSRVSDPRDCGANTALGAGADSIAGLSFSSDYRRRANWPLNCTERQRRTVLPDEIAISFAEDGTTEPRKPTHWFGASTCRGVSLHDYMRRNPRAPGPSGPEFVANLLTLADDHRFCRAIVPARGHCTPSSSKEFHSGTWRRRAASCDRRRIVIELSAFSWRGTRNAARRADLSQSRQARHPSEPKLFERWSIT